ncbi:MAG: DUF4381 domain-containing protein [Gammaproteobacteria bacterium]|nr:DUF4381 domain-containing protein [Gammaproteobacteria bacterium]
MDPASELLSELKGLSLPAAHGLGIAPGWLLLALSVLCLLLWLAWRWWHRQPAAVDWRPAARSELARLQSRVPDASTAEMLAECSRLSRRIALAAAPRTQIASLHGEAWLRQLDELSDSQLFTTGPGRLLETGPYQKPDRSADGTMDEQMPELLKAIETLLSRCEARAT